MGQYRKRKLDLSKGDVRECVEPALHEVIPSANGKRISVSADLEPDQISLYFEPGQIEQLLVNLLDNACKFTPKGGEIRVDGYPCFWERRTMRAAVSSFMDRRTEESPRLNSYRIDVWDSGPGIRREHIGTIFEEYTCCAGVLDRSGGGLGLAICKMIAELHDGLIWAENTPNGPMFSVVLPGTSKNALYPESAWQGMLPHAWSA